MKFVLIVLSVFLSIPSIAGERECRVVRSEDNNPFEEGLGVYGDPDVDDDSEIVSLPETGKIVSLSIGQMTWRTKDGDKITRQETPRKAVIYKVVPHKGKGYYAVVTYPSERGVLLRNEEGEDSVFGHIDCSSVDEVKAASIGSPGTKALTAAQRKALAKEVTTNIDKLDLPFELGDGYYDLKATRLYEVRKESKVVGFILWAKLYYTEDKDNVEVTTRFDRNGLWLGEIDR